MLKAGLDHLLSSPREHGTSVIHADHVPHKRGTHPWKVACPCDHVEGSHTLMPGQKPGEPFLELGLVGARDIGIPGGCDPLKIVPFVRFKLPQLLLWRGREIEANQSIEVLKNLLVGGKKVFETPPVVLLLEELAGAP